MFTVESVGEEFDVFLMNFGRDCAKSSCEQCKNEKLENESGEKWGFLGQTKKKQKQTKKKIKNIFYSKTFFISTKIFYVFITIQHSKN